MRFILLFFLILPKCVSWSAPIHAPNFTSHDPYENLGLDASATLSEVNARFRELSKTYHPDKGGNEEKFKFLSNARDQIASWIGLKIKLERFNQAVNASESLDLLRANRSILFDMKEIDLWNHLLGLSKEQHEAIQVIAIQIPKIDIKKSDLFNLINIPERALLVLQVAKAKRLSREWLNLLPKLDSPYKMLAIEILLVPSIFKQLDRDAFPKLSKQISRFTSSNQTLFFHAAVTHYADPSRILEALNKLTPSDSLVEKMKDPAFFKQDHLNLESKIEERNQRLARLKQEISVFLKNNPSEKSMNQDINARKKYLDLLIEGRKLEDDGAGTREIREQLAEAYKNELEKDASQHCRSILKLKENK